MTPQKFFTCVMLLVLFASGCSTMSNTEAGAAGGGLVGAGAGALIGQATGHTGAGALSPLSS